jgi:predicted nucleic acid-binding Zn ribbon protein
MDKDRFNKSQPLKDILADILKKPQLSKGLNETRALDAWAKVLGPSVARITTSIYIRNGVLYARLNSSIIRSELLMHKDQIIASINAEVGANAVRDMILQ